MSVTAAAPQHYAQPAPVAPVHGMQKTIFASPRVIEKVRAGLTNPKARARFEAMLQKGEVIAVREVSRQ